jgi:hypothetical protein
MRRRAALPRVPQVGSRPMRVSAGPGVVRSWPFFGEVTAARCPLSCDWLRGQRSALIDGILGA